MYSINNVLVFVRPTFLAPAFALQINLPLTLIFLACSGSSSSSSLVAVDLVVVCCCRCCSNSNDVIQMNGVSKKRLLNDIYQSTTVWEAISVLSSD